MTETSEQYTRRILAHLGKDDPFAVLRSTPRVLRRIVRGAPGRALRSRPASGKWAVSEILAHLADTELVWSYRIRRILESRGAELQGMDQNRWCRNLGYSSIPTSQSIATFEALREWDLALFERLPAGSPRAWGSHTQFGRLPISKIVRLLAGHDRNHLGQIRAILRK